MKRGVPPLSAEQARQSLRASAKRMGQRCLPSDWPPFVDYAWDTFEPRTVIALLMSEEPSYVGHKDILFAGLCTWVACPDRRDGLRKHGMLLVGIEQLRRAEELGRRAALGGSAMIADMIGRLSAIGPDFYSDFYYPIGGIAQILRSTTPQHYRRSLVARSKEIPTLIAMMQVFDFHAKHLASDALYYPASLAKGTKLVSIVYRARKEAGGINRDDADKRWKRSFQTAALSYAASTIRVDGQGSLLDLIRDGDAKYETHGHLLPQWLARARYAADTLLGGLPEPRFAKANASHLPELKPEPTPEPSFSDKEQEVITSAFDIKRTLKSRGWTEPVPRPTRKAN